MSALRAFARLPRVERGVVVRAALSSLVLNVVLHVRGAKAARAAADRLARVAVGAPSVVDAARVGRLVNAVCERPPFRSRCLVRSLVARSVLVRHRVSSEVCLGVQRVGGRVAAHAWVEVDGVPVNDTADVAQRYARFELSDHDWSPSWT